MSKIVTYRKCVKCEKEKASSSFRNGSDECLGCVRNYDSKAYKKKWREANPEKAKSYTDKWRSNNKEKVAQTKSLWRKNNPEKVAEEKKRSYEKNKEKISKIKKEKYKQNPEPYKKTCLNYRKNNREKARLVSSEWRKNNPEAKSALDNKRRAIKANADGFYTAQEWNELCSKYDNKCLRCGEKTKLTVDHVIPLSKGGSNWISNIQPLCHSCNSTKHTDTTDYRVL